MSVSFTEPIIFMGIALAAAIITALRLFWQLKHCQGRLQKVEMLYKQDLAIASEYAEAANLAKTKFISHIVHEMRTPMNVISGIAEICLRQPSLTEKQKELMNMLQSSSKTLAALINNLLDIEKIPLDSGTGLSSKEEKSPLKH